VPVRLRGTGAVDDDTNGPEDAAMSEVRAEVVADLVAGRIREVVRAQPTTAELNAATDAMADRLKSELQATGHLKPEGASTT
jgi:hypothetical protein